MLTREQLREFDANGFVKGDVVLSEAQVERLRAELDKVMAGETVRKPVLNRNLLEGQTEYSLGMEVKSEETVVQIVNIWMASDAFFEHACNPRICEEVAQLTGSDTLRIWHDQVQYKPPVKGGPTYWHQDHPAWPIIQPADLVSAWVALDDAEIDNGCMWMVPGSHRWGDFGKYIKTDRTNYTPYLTDPGLLPQGVDITPVPFEIKKGQVGYHHCLTWHGARPNPTERKRRAIAVHYMPAHIRYEPTGSHPMEKFVRVKAGEILAGDDFPVVYRKEPAVSR